MDIEKAIYSQFAIPIIGYDFSDRPLISKLLNSRPLCVQGSMISDHNLAKTAATDDIDVYSRHFVAPRAYTNIDNYKNYISSLMTIYGLNRIFTMARAVTTDSNLWVTYSIGYFTKSEIYFYTEKVRESKKFDLYDTGIVEKISKTREIHKLVTESYHDYDLLTMEELKKVRPYF